MFRLKVAAMQCTILAFLKSLGANLKSLERHMFEEMNLNEILRLNSHSDEERQALVSLLNDREGYLEKLLEATRLRRKALESNDPADYEAASDHSTAVVLPLRRNLQLKMAELMEQAVDVEGLKMMAPMLLLASVQHINVPLLLEAFGASPEDIAEQVSHLKRFMRRDMPDAD